MPLPKVSQETADKIIGRKTDLSTVESLDEFAKEQPALAEYLAIMVVSFPSIAHFIAGAAIFIYDGLKEQMEVDNLEEFKKMYEAE